MDADILAALDRWDSQLHDCLARAVPDDDWDADLATLGELAGLGQRLVELVMAQRGRLERRLPS